MIEKKNKKRLEKLEEQDCYSCNDIYLDDPNNPNEFNIHDREY